MRRILTYAKTALLSLTAVVALAMVSCSVSYKFNGASIDYTKTKTIQIADFPIRSSYVWGPMGPMFNNQLKDMFASHTKLSQVKRNGDLKIEGEITQYSQRNKSVAADGRSAQTELSITVNAKTALLSLTAVVALAMVSCSVSYKFNGASIDYTKTKTIQIADFPIRSSYVWGPMGPMFNNQLKDMFASHTKLSQVKRNGDLKIEGEITQYSQRNKSVAADGRSAQTELSITVNVRFTNNANHSEDFERQFTANKSYETTQSLASVQEELVTQMVKDLTEQIFNATVANW